MQHLATVSRRQSGAFAVGSERAVGSLQSHDRPKFAVTCPNRQIIFSIEPDTAECEVSFLHSRSQLNLRRSADCWDPAKQALTPSNPISVFDDQRPPVPLQAARGLHLLLATPTHLWERSTT